MFTEKYLLSYDQYWEAYRILFDQSEIISVTEPLVNTFLGLGNGSGTPCGGSSIRITPDRRLKPCVYWPESDLTIEDLVDKKKTVFQTPLFQDTHKTPQFCLGCEHVKSCGGGCAARRILRGRPDEPDEYCPVVRADKIQLNPQPSSAERPLRTGSICTTIVKGI
jgi:radical SAM protein with 4Fe4S-binding SPASM domain